MKKALTLLALLSFLFVNGQYKKGVVFLKNGDTLKGLIKKRKTSGIKFKDSLNSRVIILTHKKIIGFDSNDEKYRYKYDKFSYRHFVKIILRGKISLFSKTYYSQGSPVIDGFGRSLGVNYGGGTSTNYFIEKNGVFIKLGIKIKKKHYIYFKDCPDLIEKLKKKKIRKGNVIRTIHYYNKNCK